MMIVTTLVSSLSLVVSPMPVVMTFANVIYKHHTMTIATIAPPPHDALPPSVRLG